ncbi:MAG: AbiEi antitoxin N-terminal domain-containing protein [Pseudomonadota bacterium]|uniref:type IV toxin-antitoxin system AbiEi family antitoxin domain-containing protein n=2 Tax=unclassified Sphingomonas TaxID=196159 RepID=UPI001AC8E1E3|nr:AbiEi antitoxin N-terminal domain-containing protein [Sphingomonas sp.]MBN8848039.1 AbiEi antitoxin N-terminal domain-containing protein [Sphingomonas sp.]MBN9015755.1 AbiEi antitoxin N-terminal domain-containing protein [Hyphomicrobiales bacterium]
MPDEQKSQRATLRALFEAQPILRAHELRTAGVAAQTIARALDDGELDRIARGLYQRHGASIETDQALAEVAKRIPKGVIAMLSALAYHQLTDQMPRRVWIALGKSDWSPAPSYPPIRLVRFSDQYLRQGVEHHQIAGVMVPIYSIPKTIADLFRNPKLVDRSVAIEGLRAALDQRKVRPAEISESAQAGGVWKTMQPYLEALTSNG